MFEPRRENLSSVFASNKGAVQPAYLGSLIRAAVIRCLESIISKLSTGEIYFFYLVFVERRQV